MPRCQFSTGPWPWAAGAITYRESNQIEGTHAKTNESKISIKLIKNAWRQTFGFFIF